MEPIFKFIPHPDFPEHYSICKYTGACKYLLAKKREYSDTYFSEEYRNQYNKTYYEDEPSIRKLAKRRLSILQRFISFNNKSLLEIGCAAGFFLDEARQAGFTAKGIEISQSETVYAKSLGLDVVSRSFIDFEIDKKYDVICAFFVLEHFEEQEAVLFKIRSMLNLGGLVFLALPSIYGPTFQTNPKEWFKTHPIDHFMDYSPMSISKLSNRMGMRVVYKEPMSYHPHRDKGWRGRFPFRYFYKTLAYNLCYGDTMQILIQFQ